jgi:signal transduction histidine kinase
MTGCDLAAPDARPRMASVTDRAEKMHLGIRGSLAIAAVVVDGVVNTVVLAESDAPLLAGGPAPYLPGVIAASVVFLVLGFGTRWISRMGALLYVAVLALLAAGCVWWSRGAASLAPLPVVSIVGLAYDRRWVVLTAAIYTAFVAAVMGHLWGTDLVIASTIGFVASAVFVVAFTEIAVGERRARSELAVAHEKLAGYAARAEELATIEERNRLARELHDSLGHYLSVIHVQLEAARTLIERDPARAAQALATSERLTREGLDDVRRSVASLRARAIHQPLGDAVGDLAREHAASGVATELAITGTPRPVSPPVELALYRAAQEALTNCRKHARATRVRIELCYQADRVRLSVEDDGRGAPEPTGGFGLLGVRERARLAGGQLTIRSAAGAGFALAIEVPT